MDDEIDFLGLYIIFVRVANSKSTEAGSSNDAVVTSQGVFTALPPPHCKRRSSWRFHHTSCVYSAITSSGDLNFAHRESLSTIDSKYMMIFVACKSISVRQR